MAGQPIREGFDVFVHDGDKVFGAVRQVSPHNRPELVVYVENAGDFTVPLSAVKGVESGKVILDCGKLAYSLRKAVGHAHEDGDPVDRSSASSERATRSLLTGPL